MAICWVNMDFTGKKILCMLIMKWLIFAYDSFSRRRILRKEDKAADTEY